MDEPEGVGEASGAHSVTAYRWYRDGRLPVPAQRAGRLILVEAPISRAMEAVTGSAP
jgi:predicted site-specific integrase-resolvase